MRVNNPDRSPVGSIAETQPQLQRRLLRLSAIISQSFTCHGVCLFRSPHSNDKNGKLKRALHRARVPV